MTNLISTPVEIEQILDPDGKCVDPAVYVQSETDNATIDENAGKSAFDALAQTPDVDSESFVGNELSEEFLNLGKRYGNNAFELEVEQTRLFGVLKEIPPLQLSSKWKPNVVADIIDTLQNWSSNTKVQMINSIFGVKQFPWIAGGDSTTQTYVGCSDTQFTLQFRIYSMEAIGPSNLMSGYKRVLAALCIYAPPLHTFDASQILALNVINFGGTVIALQDALAGTLDFTAQKLGITEEEYTKTQAGEKVKKAISKGFTDLGEVASASTSAFLADNTTDRTAQLKRLSKAIKTGADDLQAFLTDKRFAKPDNERVDNPLNYYHGIYGGALWNLSILPGIFSHKIPVYVKSWKAKPSKEIDSTGKAAYMDFTVTCVLDQIKTGNWWANEIYAPEADAYKNLYRKKVKEPN